MYFDVFINGKNIGTFGHDSVENLNVSLSSSNDGIFIFSGAVCREGEKQYHLSWSEIEIDPNDKVEIIQSQTRKATAIKRKYEMGRAKRKARADNICEFCQRNETEVLKMIRGDDNRPGICSDCVDLCNDILANNT